MTSVVHLTTVHRPFDIRIFHKECGSLRDAGYDVTLIAPHERDELVDGIKVIGLPGARSRAARLLASSWRAYRAVVRVDPEVVHFHDPELLLMALALKTRGYRVVYDVHEDLPKQVLTKGWIPRILRAPVAWFCSIAEQSLTLALDGVVAATPGIASRFPSDRTVLVRNYPLLREFNAAQGTPYLERPAHAIYVGGMNRLRGLYHMVDATSQLPSRLGARLRLAGNVSLDDARSLQDRSGWSKTDRLGWLSRDAITAEMGCARIGMVVLHPCSSYVESLPIKLFEYMAAGIPVIASDFPLWREIVDQARCGIVVDPLDATVISHAMQWLFEHPGEAAAMGQRGQRAVREMFNWEGESQKLVNLYRERVA